MQDYVDFLLLPLLPPPSDSGGEILCAIYFFFYVYIFCSFDAVFNPLLANLYSLIVLWILQPSLI